MQLMGGEHAVTGCRCHDHAHLLPGLGSVLHIPPPLSSLSFRPSAKTTLNTHARMRAYMHVHACVYTLIVSPGSHHSLIHSFKAGMFISLSTSPPSPTRPYREIQE